MGGTYQYCHYVVKTVWAAMPIVFPDCLHRRVSTAIVIMHAIPLRYLENFSKRNFSNLVIKFYI